MSSTGYVNTPGSLQIVSLSRVQYTAVVYLIPLPVQPFCVLSRSCGPAKHAV